MGVSKGMPMFAHLINSTKNDRTADLVLFAATLYARVCHLMSYESPTLFDTVDLWVKLSRLQKIL